MSDSDKADLNIYACGGTGAIIVNAMGLLLKDMPDDMYKPAPFIYHYDTSYANHITEAKAEKRLIRNNNEHNQGRSGSGGVLAANYEALSNKIPGHIEKDGTADLNIIVYGTGGGTGSIAAMLIATELLKREETFIMVPSMNVRTPAEINNAVKHLMSIEHTAQSNGVNIAVFPNRVSDTFENNDIELAGSLIKLCGILDSGVMSVDAADRHNILNPQKLPDVASEVQPGALGLEIVEGMYIEDNTEDTRVVTQLTTSPIGNYEIGANPMFAKGGKSLGVLRGDGDMSIVTVQGLIPLIKKQLDASLADKKRSQGTFNAVSIGEVPEGATREGNVFL